MIESKNICAGYDKKIVLSEVSFKAEPGKVVTLIGPNGAGKSTLLKTIAKQLKPIDGDILIDNKSINAIDRKTMSVKLGLLLTKRVNPELMTCFDVVCTGRYPYTGKLGILSEEDISAAKSAMDEVHVIDLCDKYFDSISDGQRQRVMLARAICQETDYLILDEPTTYLDINYKLEFVDIVDKLREKNKGIIMSIHELELARIMSDIIICIDGNGKIDRVDSPQNIFMDDYIDSLFGMKAGSYNKFVNSI